MRIHAPRAQHVGDTRLGYDSIVKAVAVVVVSFLDDAHGICGQESEERAEQAEAGPPLSGETGPFACY